MKQLLNIIFGIIITVLILFTIYIVVESVRLRNGESLPLIVTGGTCDGDKTEHIEDYETDCEGIGFSIRRKYVLDTSTKDKTFNLIQEEFWLFDKFMLWGWIS